ncbi:MAG: metal-dependent transcriptional regulator [Kiritimatiellae bacterium]|nr:metal-dependent transcriptional regulator [Kiritimatiellia bacterium]
MAETLSSTLEDYLGAILALQQQRRFARVRDISASLGVAKSAVTAALQTLSAKGLVHYQPYEPVTLTPKGERCAKEIALRHEVVRDFLENILGMRRQKAESIACQMEHAIDGPALNRFVCFLAFVGTRPGKGKTWLNEFKRFVAKGAGGQTCRKCIGEYLQNTRCTIDAKQT